MIRPTLDEVKAMAKTAGGNVVPIYKEVTADLETPVSAMLKLAEGRPLSFLLESVEGGEVRGRYSIIGLEPDTVWRAFGNRAEVNRTPRKAPDAFEPEPEPTLASLRALLERSRIETPPGLPPMAAGVFGYFGYDNVRLIEHLPNVPPDKLGVPDAILVRPTVMVIFDAVKDEMTLVTPVYPEKRGDPAKAYDAARRRYEDQRALMLAGAATPNDVLEAENLLRRAELLWIDAFIHVRMAHAALLKAQGETGLASGPRITP